MDHFATKSMVKYHKNTHFLNLKVGKNLILFEAQSKGYPQYHYQDKPLLSYPFSMSNYRFLDNINSHSNKLALKFNAVLAIYFPV